MTVSLRPVVNVHDASNSETRLVRRLHGERYLAEGYVDALSEDGTIDDAYVDHSQYLVATDATNDAVVGTCRLITSEHHRFPLLDHMVVDRSWVEQLHATPSRAIAEVSALATERTCLGHFVVSAALCREAIQRSLIETRRKYLLCIVDQRLLRVLNRVFHLGLVAIGPMQEYMGPTLPAVLDLDEFVTSMRARDDETAEYFLHGLSLEELDRLVIDLREPVPATGPKVYPA